MVLLNKISEEENIYDFFIYNKLFLLYFYDVFKIIMKIVKENVVC